MKQRDKLNEARYFLARMRAALDDRVAFEYDLSAFLSASRSSLQFALEDAKRKQGGQAWYDKSMQNSAVCRFLKDKRDINIHEEPVRPQRSVSIEAMASVHFTETLEIEVIRNGEAIDRRSQSSGVGSNEAASVDVPVTVTVTYVFNDWVGSEDVLSLCGKYVQDIDDIINDGVAKGFIA